MSKEHMKKPYWPWHYSCFVNNHEKQPIIPLNSHNILNKYSRTLLNPSDFLPEIQQYLSYKYKTNNDLTIFCDFFVTKFDKLNNLYK